MNLQKVLTIVQAAEKVYGELEGQAAHERLSLARTELFNALREGREALANIQAEWDKMKEVYLASEENPEHVNEPVHPALIDVPGIQLAKEPKADASVPEHEPLPSQPEHDPNQDGA